MKRDGITQLVVLPLYPQFSVSTSGSSLRLLERLLKEDPVLARVRVLLFQSLLLCDDYNCLYWICSWGQTALLLKEDPVLAWVGGGWVGGGGGRGR